MENKELCQQCGGRYKTPQLLRIHFQVTHKVECVKCKECDEMFKGKKMMYNHMRSHQTKQCNFCWKLFPKNSLASHLQICPARSETPNFKCNICLFESARKQKLQSHVLSIHQKQNKANKIEKYTQKKLPLQHSADHLKNYECTVCYKTFPRKFSLTRHTNTKHLQKKLKMRSGFGIFEDNVNYSQFECNICSYKTNRSNNLKKHKMNKHEKEKKEKLTNCDKCEFTSSYPKNVKKHMETTKHQQQKENSIATKNMKIKDIKQEIKEIMKVKEESTQIFGKKEVNILLDNCEGSQHDLLRVMRKCFGKWTQDAGCNWLYDTGNTLL